MSKILVLDVETGGTDPDKHSLLSIGAVVLDNFRIVDEIELLINDGRLVTTPEALKVNNIDLEQHRKDALGAYDAYVKFDAFLKKNFDWKRIMVAGHNVHFDVEFLKRFYGLIIGSDYSKRFDFRIIDTYSIANFLYMSEKLNSWQLTSDALFGYFGIKVDGRHTALGDAKATAKMIVKMVEMNRSGTFSVED